MRHGLKTPARTPEERVQQRLANIENHQLNAMAPLQADEGRRMRIIRGVIATGGSGSIVAGSGFSISGRAGTGDVTIAFTNAFPATPTVLLTMQPGSGWWGFCLLAASGTGGIQVQCRDGAGNAADQTFHFIAIGWATS